MVAIPLKSNNILNLTQTQDIREAHKEFLPEKDIPNESVLREDYEKLRITYELQRDIGSEIELDIVLNRILDRTFEFLKYDRGVILLLNKNGTLKPRASKNISGKSIKSLSKTLIRHVIDKKEGVISSDILTDQRFNKASSIILSGLLSTIAAPILHGNEVLGVIVIESSKKISAFSEKDLLLIMNIATHTAQFIKNSLLHEEFRLLFDSAILTLSATVDAKHTLTAGHSERVAKLSILIAKTLGLNRDRLKILNYAALLHDIGKIGISDKVLLKNGPFTDSEREEMNTHPIKTKEILDKFYFPRMMKKIPAISALHHERVDGTGYPNGLKGTDLPLEAKIISVADVFDALTSKRDYPKYDKHGNELECEKMSSSQAMSIIEKETGSHFDAEVVNALKKCLKLI
jgi:HD-GYP domain-containing protein (c-di-GMP phosphodiesterase class II)